MADSLVGLKVLIVEDDHLIASLVEHSLKSAGCIVPEPIPEVVRAQEATRRDDYDAADPPTSSKIAAGKQWPLGVQ
jgi:CheY-like chemotaxis protein